MIISLVQGMRSIAIYIDLLADPANLISAVFKLCKLYLFGDETSVIVPRGDFPNINYSV